MLPLRNHDMLMLEKRQPTLALQLAAASPAASLFLVQPLVGAERCLRGEPFGTHPWTRCPGHQRRGMAVSAAAGNSADNPDRDPSRGEIRLERPDAGRRGRLRYAQRLISRLGVKRCKE